MALFTSDQVVAFNERFKNATPKEIVSFAIEQAAKPVVTTNFRPYEGAILFACSTVEKTIPVIWCDSGYNTEATYKHAEDLIESLALKVDLYTPLQTAAHRNIVMGIPEITDSRHTVFTEQVKLEPFKRAMNAHKPDVWFTNLRKGQTALRDSLDIFSLSKDGVLKVSPFYNYDDAQLDEYLKANDLPNEFDYYDPTKVLAHRECGIHL